MTLPLNFAKRKVSCWSTITHLKLDTVPYIVDWLCYILLIARYKSVILEIKNGKSDLLRGSACENGGGDHCILAI